ncbi:hypothetical protein Ahy_A08g038660 [Arachis hypogaea]|uniref:Aminotransferase-like plant mobile domain-containing protein n=1 Tax=Arachis hypogaea TaxID=3818 RepID=A0A445BTZ5_ARAHY|nr:hypothetical protein Ahy_A08g038660 [Arachis hypogaea]
MAEARSLYRLNGVTHVFGSINEERQQNMPLHDRIVRIYARTYIMMLLSTQLFIDKSRNRLPFVARLDDMGSYNWGSTALAWLYRCMCWVANRNATYLPSSDRKEERVVQCRLALNRLGDQDPYASLDVMAIVHPEILTEEHSWLWRTCTYLIYFAVIEWH